MTREELSKIALSKIDTTKCLILELITGYGKTKMSIDITNHICDRVFNKTHTTPSILILVAKTVHKQTWRDEINKWGGIKSNSITIECYESFKKYENKSFDIIIMDEVHHLSLSRIKLLESIKVNEAIIGLSATIKKDLRDYFKTKYQAEIIYCGLKEAVKENILPEPDVYLLPLELNNTVYKYQTKRFGRIVTVTQKGYYDNMSSLIDWYKEKYMTSRNERMKNMWLSSAGKRLKWCSEQKEDIVFRIIKKFKDYKTLTFCSSIEQSERLGEYNITSKNKYSTYYLNMFNSNKIKHITAVNILNEGVNLHNCKIGIFCNINSSEIITKQKIGRLLRHKSPVIIIPYFRNTREVELVKKMTEEYNEDKIHFIRDYNDIKL